MTTEVLLKGDDIQVLLNNEIIGGIVKLTVKETEEYYNIQEYLSGEFVDQIPLKREYEITVEKAYTEENVFKEIKNFEIAVKAEKSETVYGGCVLAEKTDNFSQKNPLFSVYRIIAKSKSEKEV